MNQIEQITKPDAVYWSDWFQNAFIGYGDGERAVIPAIRLFFELTFGGSYQRSYDYREVEDRIGAAAAWMLIARLVELGIIEYGTSPRYGWLTEIGTRLRDHVLSRTADQLIDEAYDKQEFSGCYPGCCNCGPEGHIEGVDCKNPFFKKMYGPR